MEELKKRLTRELQQDFNVKMMGSPQSWGLPVHSIEIAYQTVKRTKMDILMKMMLIAFQKAKIAMVEEPSEILLVEQVFIKDVIDKMVRAHMIEKRGDFYALTAVGLQQLEIGQFEHEPENGSNEVLYSPCHRSFLKGELKGASVEGLEDYRYKKDYDDWKLTSIEEEALLNALKAIGVESDEGNVQIVVSEIITAVDIQFDQVPCLEFHLYNAAEDALYARVWNTLTEQWDETLEGQLNEKERKEWRENYL